ncbi:hypothetical protein LPL18_005780 [Halomonas sp. CUBES01]|uniref:hypothetical protein n=1 Tax=Halomonas sp. CUBES01 TaxID=2897340 RepID=UPI001E32DCB1|nr:hypothetical protein [Halomonas sp. CUBES01]MEC4766842.1 hypothetical protein [Halomonas sp. CUBES01]
MELHYTIPNMRQLRHELQTVLEAHSASNGIDDARAIRDAFVCLIKEMQDEGYTTEHIEMLVALAMDLNTAKGD